jgi:hypothetical protein
MFRIRHQGESIMPIQERKTKAGSIILSIVALTGIAGIAVGAVGTDRSRASVERPGWLDPGQPPTLSDHMGTLDEAIAARDLGRATREWRNAYSLALASRRWDAMADMGDAAVRIDAMGRRPGDYPTGFRAEARQAYLRALFQARSQGARDGIERVAQAFAALGDTEMALRARALAGTTR